MEEPKDTVIVMRDNTTSVVLQFIICIFLFVIAFLLYSIYRAMPPALGDLLKAQDQASKQQVLLRQPIVAIPATLSVDVENPTLSVEVTELPSGVDPPLAVEVRNALPIEVTLVDSYGRPLR